MSISPENLENAIAAMDGYMNQNDTDAQGYVGGIYAAYVPDILGPEGLCVSQAEAQAEVAARTATMKMMEASKSSVPEALFNQWNFMYWNPKRLEDQSAALLANAAANADCPDGSNTSTVTFEFEGEQHTTDAEHLLLSVKGAGALRKYPNIYTQDILKRRIKAADQITIHSDKDFSSYVIAQDARITAEQMLSLLRRYNLP